MILEELAQRCEAAIGPDRDLDNAIMAVLFRRESRHIGCQEEQDDGSWAPVKDDVWVDPATDQWIGTGAREFTSSLNDAVGLIPNGWPIENLSWWPSVPNGYESERCCRLTIMDLDDRGFGGRKRFKAEAKTPALAISAAALRAKASLALTSKQSS